LRDELDLHGVPRNLENPGYFSMYSVAGDGDGDAKLTAWMHSRLTLAVWPAAEGMRTPVADVETELIRYFTPVVNLDKNPKKLAQLKAARKAMSAEARAWQPVSD
jgi:hypothetical protein